MDRSEHNGYFLSLLERKYRAPGARICARSFYKLCKAKDIMDSPCHLAFILYKMLLSMGRVQLPKM